jgi:CRISPR system Cascade subunit CasD
VPDATLTLCLDAPMQSWGLRSRFTQRDTAAEPTKSGLVGLLMAALGRSRDDDACTDRLARLRLGIRVEREGTVERDYHTTANVPTASGTSPKMIIGHRYYLADAVFLAVLQGEPDLLTQLHDALAHPRWPLYLGRRAFAPARPLISPARDGQPSALSDTDLDTVLRTHPWQENHSAHRARATHGIEQGAAVHLRTMVDSVPALPAAEMRYDRPVSFRPDTRHYAARAVVTGHVPLTSAMLRPAPLIP